MLRQSKCVAQPGVATVRYEDTRVGEEREKEEGILDGAASLNASVFLVGTRDYVMAQ